MYFPIIPWLSMYDGWPCCASKMELKDIGEKMLQSKNLVMN